MAKRDQNYQATLRATAYPHDPVDIPGPARSPAVGGNGSPLPDDDFSRLWGVFEVGPYWVRLFFCAFEGRLELTGVDVRAYPGRSGVPAPLTTSGTLRRLPLQDMTAQLVSSYRSRLEAQADPDSISRQGLPEETRMEQARVSKRLSPVARRTPNLSRPGRRGWDREHYEEVARIYNEAWRLQRNPTKVVAEELGVPYSTASHWVATCRTDDYKLLPKTTQRQAKGATPEPVTPAKKSARRKGKSDA